MNELELHQEEEEALEAQQSQRNVLNEVEAAEEEEEEALEANPPQSSSCCYRGLSKVCCKCFMDLPETWPRTTSLCLGVVLPLWSLLLISYWFGSYLSELESSGEYDSNDGWMAARSQSVAAIDVLASTSEVLPQICAEVYFDPTQSLETLEDDLAEIVRLGTAEEFLAELNETASTSNSTLRVNMTEMIDFMEECGQVFGNITGNLANNALKEIVAQESLGLSFAWTRCAGQSKCLVAPSVCELLGVNRSAYLPATQSAVFADNWENDRDVLFEFYYNRSLSNGRRPAIAAVNSLDRATREATGRGNCTVNTPSGAWFWFTVMSTIGYGNQAPSTDGGKAMIYTLGFASILTFGGILASSGFIVTSIFDDAVGRLKYSSLLSTPFGGSLLWGSLYYGWMIAIAGYTVIWKEERLAQDFEFKDAFWFAYISTTTVGLGDFYLEPEVLQRDDLLIWPILFLFGFVLLANFLMKFTELVLSFLPHKENPLAERLENTSLLRCRPRKSKLQKRDETNEIQEQTSSEMGSSRRFSTKEAENDTAEQTDLDETNHIKGSEKWVEGANHPGLAVSGVAVEDEASTPAVWS